MELIAGSVTGSLMTLFFVGHVALVLVHHPPRFVLHASRAESSRRNLKIAMGTVIGAMIFWPAVGIVAALLFAEMRHTFPTNLPAIPSVFYLLFILASAIVSAPLPILLLRSLKRHVLIEYLFFVAIFGLMLPWIVGER